MDGERTKTERERGAGGQKDEEKAATLGKMLQSRRSESEEAV